ncbi:ABC transporter ATP-binding protein [Salinarchaeum laminariae]|uniref:ABC transporter ATP-binding protein n=1 Tax=Salinarchaeum laminariae TaxID=869888 RepID=UPI0020BF6861|nr:ABC transporter ATP-binding protein [Salinarchaeum laminariae]
MAEQRRKPSESSSLSESSASGAVHVDGLTKQYDDVVAVSDLDLHVEPGELLVLLGPSGCGKTTTLRSIAGLEHVTDGTIHFDDEDVTRQAPQRRDVAMVFQSYALYPHKTVRGNLQFPLRKTDISGTEATERVEEIAELLEMETHLDTRPAQLSGGQRQRVAVGRALVRQPHLLCMDEPLSNLDAKLRVETRSELRQLQQRLGITTIYVTHDQEEAMSIADRIAVMNDGRIEQVGTPEDVYERPANEFVASFVGDPPMNFCDPDDVQAAGIETPQSAAGSPDTIGIRPEYIYPTDSRGEPAAGDRVEVDRPSDPVVLTVELIEPVGRAYEIQLTGHGLDLVARLRTRPDDVTEGDSSEFVFDLDRLTTFNDAGEVV